MDSQLVVPFFKKNVIADLQTCCIHDRQVHAEPLA